MAKYQITPFGQRVKDALKAKGMTQGDLAEKLGVSNQFLYLILFGKKPGTKQLPVIAAICGISMEPNTEDSDKTWEPFEKSTEPVDEIWMDIPDTLKERKTQKKQKQQKKQQKQKETHEFTPFGVRVSEALERMGMKQVELARAVGTSKQYLYMILHGQRSGRKYLRAIAQICDIEWASIVDEL